jgi:hypothetical protein
LFIKVRPWFDRAWFDRGGGLDDYTVRQTANDACSCLVDQALAGCRYGVAAREGRSLPIST